MLLDAPINLDALVFKSQFVSDWHITFTTDVSILPFFFFSFLGGFFLSILLQVYESAYTEWQTIQILRPTLQGLKKQMT